MKSVRKKDLLTDLASSFPEHDSADIDQAVEIVLSTISDALAKGKAIKIRRFGSFHLSRQKGRSFLNPKNGKISTYNEINRIVFTPSPDLVIKEKAEVVEAEEEDVVR